MTFKNPKDEVIFDILKKAKRIAVVGLSDKPDRTSYQVAQVIQAAGYEIIPVNPALQGKEVLGEKSYDTLTEVPGHIDIVDIFRRSEFLPAIAEEFNQIDADVFWAQLGIENQEAADFLVANGHKKIIMNRCIKVEYHRLKEQA